MAQALYHLSDFPIIEKLMMASLVKPGFFLFLVHS